MERKTWVLFFEGNYQPFANVPGTLSRIYQVTVPKGQVWELDPERPFVLYFLAQDLNLTPSATTNGNVAPSHGVLIPARADGSPTPPGRYEVLVGTIGGTRQRLTIADRTPTSIAFTGTVDVGTNIDAFYIPDRPARLQLRVQDPRTMVTVGYVALAEDPTILMRPNPFHENTMYRLTTPMLIPSDFILSLWIQADYTVAWRDTAANPTNLPAMMQLPIIIHRRQELPADLEGDLTELTARETPIDRLMEDEELAYEVEELMEDIAETEDLADEIAEMEEEEIEDWEPEEEFVSPLEEEEN